MYNSGRGDVSSPWAPTTPGMALQCLEWQYSGGDGRTGPELAEETRSTSPTSQRRPVWTRGRRMYPFRGFRRPPSRGVARSCTGVDGTVSRSRHWPYCTVSYSAKDGLTKRVGETAPGYDFQAVSEGRRGGDSPLTRAPASYWSI
jgi:hypothetical protein